MQSLLMILLLWLPPQAQDETLNKRIDDFAGKIIADGDEGLDLFRDVLKTAAGKIVLGDRAGKAVEKLRQKAERDAVPEYFRTHFEGNPGTLKLRDGHEAFRKELIDGSKIYQADMKKIQPVIDDLAENLVEEPEVNAKLAEFLKSRQGPAVLYTQVVRPMARPGVDVIARLLGGIFVRDKEGRYYVPESKLDYARGVVDSVKPAMEGAEQISKQLKEFAKEIAETDEFHKKLRKAAGDPLFTALLLKDAVNQEADPEQVEELVDTLMDQLEEAFDRTDEGRVLNEESLEEGKELLNQYTQVRSKVAAIRAPVRKFAHRLRKGDELLEGLRKVLQSDIVLVALAGQIDDVEADPVKALKSVLSQVVTQDDDGKYRIVPEAEQDVAEGIRKLSRQAGSQRKTIRLIDENAEKLEDEELRKIYLSTYGKTAIGEAAREALALKTFDGLGAWIQKHFEESEKGYTLRDGSDREIVAVLAQVDKILEELEDDDFDD